MAISYMQRITQLTVDYVANYTTKPWIMQRITQLKPIFIATPVANYTTKPWIMQRITQLKPIFIATPVANYTTKLEWETSTTQHKTMDYVANYTTKLYIFSCSCSELHN